MYKAYLTNDTMADGTLNGNRLNKALEKCVINENNFNIIKYDPNGIFKDLKKEIEL